MPLLSRSKFPPGGFTYYEPTINWPSKKHPLTPRLPFGMVVSAMQKARANNPAAGLDPSREACEAALDRYTCERLHHNPEWCVPAEAPVARTIAQARKPVPCASCGRKRRAG